MEDAKHFSAIVITRNEERNIDRCLKSLVKVTDDIVVVDSGSTDRTTELAAQYTGKIFEKQWAGFGQARNFAAGQTKYQYALALDADEELSEDLIARLKALVPQPDTVYALDRINRFDNRWIKHGSWYPDWKLRLYPAGDSLWTHDAVHETLQFPDTFKIVRLQGKLLHYTAPDPRQFAEKMDRYARLAAEDKHKQGKRVSMLKAFFKAVYRFLSSWMFRLGFLDGIPGWRLALLEARTVYKRYIYLRRMRKAGRVEL